MESSATGQPLEPAAMERLANDTERHASRELNPDSRLMYGAWGAAYLIGFSLMWLAQRSDPVLPMKLAAPIYGLCLGLAGLVTSWTVASTRQGVGGPDAAFGQRWGLSWLISFAGYGMILAGLARALDKFDDNVDAGAIMNLLAPVLAVFLVGMLYLYGGGHWRQSLMFPTAIWLITMAGVACIVGTPNHLLVLGIGGGGGLILAAALVKNPEARR